MEASVGVFKRRRPVSKWGEPGTTIQRWIMSMTENRTVVTATTRELMKMAHDSQGRNRAVNTEALSEKIDPDGVHVVAFQMVHNDVEYRTLWMVKLADSMDPTNVWIDVDPKVFDDNTRLLDLSELRGEDPCLS